MSITEGIVTSYCCKSKHSFGLIDNLKKAISRPGKFCPVLPSVRDLCKQVRAEQEMKKMMDLILIGSYFIDRKAMKVATGNSVIEKLVRLVDNLYGPIGRWRLRSGNTRFFIELPIYKFANNIAKSFTPNFDSKKAKTTT